MVLQHDSTHEKPSFLLFGMDCRSPTEPAFLPAALPQPTDISDYREELMMLQGNWHLPASGKLSLSIRDNMTRSGAVAISLRRLGPGEVPPR